MDEKQFTELKQFFTSTLRESLSEQSNRLLTEMNRRFEENDEKLDMILNEILNAIGHRFNEQDAIIGGQSLTLTNHENRILHLESN
ncbi:MAG: hypothetical protein WAV04_02270 [Candidatus Microsaccharimonas sp.]|jgi:hypothetical protein